MIIKDYILFQTVIDRKKLKQKYNNLYTKLENLLFTLQKTLFIGYLFLMKLISYTVMILKFIPV
jgi:hypothetical protein